MRHDLSTGSALAFAKLSRDEREQLAAGCVAICNNHYDTDGTTSAFALLHPQAALERADALLACARAGDFFENCGELAVSIDASVAGLCDPERSFLDLSGLSDQERWQLATDHWMEHLADALDGDTAPYRSIWEPVLERLADDERGLATCARRRRAGAAHLHDELLGSGGRDRARAGL